jgi:sugar diacid utilization regulator
VAKLLAGEMVDSTELNYEFAASHLGAVACGEAAAEGLRALAAALERRLLLVAQDDGSLWAWLGGRRRIDREAVERALSSCWPGDVPAALGEPGEGFAGWRRTHRQARAALPLAVVAPTAPVHYADVALIASIVQDDLLSTSLGRIYLAPLARDQDGGETLRRTLRTYFKCERNATSTSAVLAVSRQTVVNRLRAVEERLGRSLGSCSLDLEAALRMEELAERLPVGG